MKKDLPDLKYHGTQMVFADDYRNGKPEQERQGDETDVPGSRFCAELYFCRGRTLRWLLPTNKLVLSGA
jgi:hypothetical protein